MATTEERAMERLQEIAQQFFTDTSRVKLGLEDIPAGAEYVTNLYQCGPLMHIFQPRWVDSNPTTQLYSFKIKVDFLTAIAPDKSNNLIGVNNSLVGIWKAMANPENWDSINFIPPSTSGYECETDPAQKSLFRRYSGFFYFKSGLGCQ